MNQKEEEKLIIQYFRKNFPDFPKGRLIPSESPDFVLKLSPKKSIGIELTQLVAGEEILFEIQALINKKKEKVQLYQNIRFLELWLIIYADNAFGSVNFNLQNKLEKLNASGGFTRIYLFDLFSMKIIRI